MTIPCSTLELENRKFVECPVDSGDVAVRTTICQESGETIKVEFDEAGVSVNTYNEILSLAGLATADLVLYVVPAGKILRLKRIDFSGDNKAIYSFDLNGSIQAKKRTWYTKYNESIVFENIDLVAGDIVKLIVENKTNMTADFNGNLQGDLRDA